MTSGLGKMGGSWTTEYSAVGAGFGHGRKAAPARPSLKRGASGVGIKLEGPLPHETKSHSQLVNLFNLQSKGSNIGLVILSVWSQGFMSVVPGNF